MTSEERAAKKQQLEHQREQLVGQINMINGYLQCLAEIGAEPLDRPVEPKKIARAS